MASISAVAVAIAATLQVVSGAETYLSARAVLPAETYAPGPPSGAVLTGNLNGVSIPFPGQPVQGISGVITSSTPGTYWCMPDNGYGSKANSADFLLRMYQCTPDFMTTKETRTCGAKPGVTPPSGNGMVTIGDFIQFSDPNNFAGFDIVNKDDPLRPLTGADFDIESVQRDKDGTLWIGDEFGPFILHFSPTGELLEAPIPNGNLKSPSNPFLNGGAPTVFGSRGYEGMSKYGNYLYPALEGRLVNETSVSTDPLFSRRFIYQYDIAKRVFTGRRWNYRVDTHPLGQEVFLADMQALDANRMMVLERDNFDGSPARVSSLFIKRVYVTDLRNVDADGFLVKTLVTDLLALRDSAGVSTDMPPGGWGLATLTSPRFQLGRVSVECVLPVGKNKVLVATDNNFPFDSSVIPGKPDGVEMIIVDTDPFPTFA